MPMIWLHSLSARDVHRYRGLPIILPIASVENHGVLPLGTDIVFAKCVLQRLRVDVLALPPVPISVSTEHLGTGSTLSISYRVFGEYIHELLTSLIRAVPESPTLVACFHGGSFHVLQPVVRTLRAEGVRVALYTPYPAIERYLRERYDVVYRPIHADPVEASILLACDMNMPYVEEKPIEEVIEVLRRWSRRGLVYSYGYWTWRDIAERYGVATLPASRTLGKELVDVVVSDLETSVREL